MNRRSLPGAKYPTFRTRRGGAAFANAGSVTRTSKKSSPRAALALAFAALMVTQTGCATIFTASLCAATGSSSCGSAIEAAATADMVMVGVALEAAAEADESDAYEYDYCWEHAEARGEDPDEACGYVD